jgi:sialate O-acetylesterase
MKQLFLLFCFAIFINFIPTFAQVRLPRLVRDSMVLQRNSKVKIWGWASPKEKIEITFLDKKYKAVANDNGEWQVLLSSMKSGGPYTMNIEGKNKITLHNILIGDVWLCSGQSNMAHQMELHKYKYSKEIADANNPEIRQFWVPTLTDLQQPKDDLPTGYWKSANSHDILQFSAVAYFFAKSLNEKYHVPIGIINTSVCGTPIEAWTRE